MMGVFLLIIFWKRATGFQTNLPTTVGFCERTMQQNCHQKRTEPSPVDGTYKIHRETEGVVVTYPERGKTLTLVDACYDLMKEGSKRNRCLASFSPGGGLRTGSFFRTKYNSHLESKKVSRTFPSSHTASTVTLPIHTVLGSARESQMICIHENE